MKIGTITKPNSKGQIVIPRGMRDVLGINPEVPLNLVLMMDGIFLQPIKEVIGQTENNAQFLKILERTKGNWAGDDWVQTQRKRRVLEKKEARKRRKAW